MKDETLRAVGSSFGSEDHAEAFAVHLNAALGCASTTQRLLVNGEWTCWTLVLVAPSFLPMAERLRAAFECGQRHAL
jgi:hypothetical protein